MSSIWFRTALAAAAGVLLAAAPPPPFPTADPLGDPLPRGARARLGSGRLRHGYTVSALAFSPDGKTLVSVSHEHTVRFWDVKSGKQLRAVGEDVARANVYQGSRWLLAVAYAGDGKSVAVLSQEYALRLYDAATAAERRRIALPNGITAFSLSPDGNTLASVSRSGAVEFRDVSRGGVRQLGGGPRAPAGFAVKGARMLSSTTHVAFSPGGKVVASGGRDGVVRLWDVAKGTQSAQFAGPASAISALAWSPDGKRLAAASDGRVIVWDAATRRELARRTGAPGVRTFLAFLPDNRTLVHAGGDVGRVELLDADLKPLRSIDAPRAVTAAALSPDGKTLALGSHYSAISLYDLPTGKPLPLAPGHRGHVHHVAFSADGRQVTTGGSDGTLRRWDADTGRELPRPAAAGTSIAMSQGARLTATKNPDQPVRLWEQGAAAPARVLTGSEDADLQAALTPDGRALATKHPDGTIKLWDTATGKPLRVLRGHRGRVGAVAFAPGGKLLASSGEDGSVRLWEADTGGELRRMEGFTADALSPGDARSFYARLAFSPDGRTLARGGTDGTVVVWEVASGKAVRHLRGHTGYAMSLTFSPDGRTLAVGDWMSARLWDLPTGESRGVALGHKGDVMALDFSPDGRRLASGGSDTVAYIWDVAAAFQPAPARAVKLSEKDLEARWADLASDQGEKAYQAGWDLAAAPAQAVPLLAKHLAPVKAAGEKELAKLIADLEDDDFETRTRANEALAKLGEVAEAALRKALATAKDVDLKLRLNVLLGNLKAAAPPSETLRTLRAVQVLERAGTPAARKLLKALAGGAGEALLTREAKRALER